MQKRITFTASADILAELERTTVVSNDATVRRWVRSWLILKQLKAKNDPDFPNVYSDDELEKICSFVINQRPPTPMTKGQFLALPIMATKDFDAKIGTRMQEDFFKPITFTGEDAALLRLMVGVEQVRRYIDEHMVDQL